MRYEVQRDGSQVTVSGPGVMMVSDAYLSDLGPEAIAKALNNAYNAGRVAVLEQQVANLNKAYEKAARSLVPGRQVQS